MTRAKPLLPLSPVLLAVVALCLVGGCAQRNSTQDDTALSLPSVKTVKVTATSITPEIVSFGSISYRTETTLSASVEGTIAETAVDEGDPVRRGELLARISNPQLEIGERQAESQLTSAQAAVEVAKAQLWQGQEQVQARILTLGKMSSDAAQKKREADNLAATLATRQEVFKVGGISSEQLQSLTIQSQSAETAYEDAENDFEVSQVGLRDSDIQDAGFTVPTAPADRTALLIKINTQTLQAQLDAAQAGVQTAQSNLDVAKTLIAELAVTSPISGVVAARQSSVGEHVNVGDKIFTIIEDSTVYAVFPVAEKDAMTLAEGMPVDVTVPALGDQTLHSKISTISPLIDPQSGNLSVRSLLPNNSLSLKPGLFIRARVETGAAHSADLLPKSVLAASSGSKGTLFVVRDGRVFRKEVVLVDDPQGTDKGQVEVESGLAEGEQVIDEPSPVLQDGEKVNVEK